MPFIDPEIDVSAREMLDCAMRNELGELADLIQSVGAGQYKRILGMCLAAAAYIAVETVGRWPTNDKVREIARFVEEHEMELPLDRADVYKYLADGALGFYPLADVLTGDDAALPVLVTASMLSAFCPEGQAWESYLTHVWSAYEAAYDVELSVLPALQVRAEMHKVLSARGAVPS